MWFNKKYHPEIQIQKSRKILLTHEGLGIELFQVSGEKLCTEKGTNCKEHIRFYSILPWRIGKRTNEQNIEIRDTKLVV